MKIRFEQGIRKSKKSNKAVMIILEIHDGIPVTIFEIWITENLTDNKNDNYRFYVPYLN
jgi:hypothetical protein